MKIQLLLKRDGGSKIELGGKEYHFVPNDDGAHVAEVTDPAAIGRFLSISEHYKIYGETDMSAADVQSLIQQSKLDWEGAAQEDAGDDEPEEPDSDPENDDDDDDGGSPGLVGSAVLDMVIDFKGAEILQEDLVNAAFKKSALTAEDWNDLDDDEREALIEAELNAIKAVITGDNADKEAAGDATKLAPSSPAAAPAAPATPKPAAKPRAKPAAKKPAKKSHTTRPAAK